MPLQVRELVIRATIGKPEVLPSRLSQQEIERLKKDLLRECLHKVKAELKRQPKR